MYTVFWGWRTYGDPAGNEYVAYGLFDNGLDQTFGLGGTRWINTETQYTGSSDFWLGSGSWAPVNLTGLLAGSYYDEHAVPPPGATIQGSDVTNEINYLVSNGIISIGKDTLVELMLPPGFAPPAAGTCAAHWVWNGILMAWVAYPQQGGGCPLDPTQAMTHEFVEAVTDPAGLGWTQPGSGGSEIGDLCQSSSKTFQIQVQPLHGWTLPSLYRTQQFWSDEAHECVYARSTNAFVFGIGMDHKLWAEYVQSDSQAQLYGWYSWGSPNGNTANFVYGPGATSWGPGRLDVFAVRQGGQLDHAWSENTGNSIQWETLPPLPSGVFASSPDAVSWGAGNLQVWVKGEVFFGNGSWYTTIWSNTYEWGSGWQGWTSWRPDIQPATKISVASPMASSVSGSSTTQTRSVYAAFVDTNGLLNSPSCRTA